MLKKCYNITRNVVVAIVLAIAIGYMCLYIAVSLPPVQRWLGDTVSEALQDYFGGEVEIGRVEISPFNRLTLRDISITSPDNIHVADIEKLGAGISLYDLFVHRKIVVTYAELIGLDADIVQKKKDGPLNIQYIIDAVSPNDKTKPPTQFDLAIHSIVIRKCSVNYDKLYLPPTDTACFDQNHIHVRDLRADIDLPRIANDNFEVDIKRMSLKLDCGLEIKMLRLMTHVTNKELSLTGFSLQLPGSEITLPDFSIQYDGYNNIPSALLREPRQIKVDNWKVTPADLKCFLPLLEQFNTPLTLGLDATVSESSVTVRDLKLKYPEFDSNISIEKVIVSGLRDFHQMHFEVRNLSSNISAKAIEKGLSTASNTASVEKYLRPLGDIRLQASASGTLADITGDVKIETEAGTVIVDGAYSSANNHKHISGTVNAEELQIGRIAGIEELGACSFDIDADLTLLNKDFEGDISLTATSITYRGYTYHDINAEAHRKDKNTELALNINDNNLGLNLQASSPNLSLPININSIPDVDLGINLDRLYPLALNPSPQLSKLQSAQFKLAGSISGNTLQTLHGNVDISDILISLAGKGDLEIPYINASIKQTEAPGQDVISMLCPDLTVDATGDIYIPTLPKMFKAIAANLINGNTEWKPDINPDYANKFKFDIALQKENSILRQLNLPIQLLENGTLSGEIDSSTGLASVDVAMPWIQQGNNKLIHATTLQALVDCSQGIGKIGISSTLPAKKSDVRLDINALAKGGKIDTRIGWQFYKETDYYGNIDISTNIKRDPLNGKLSATAEIQKSDFLVNDTVWHIDPARIDLSGNDISVKDLKIWREGQFAQIGGNLSADPNQQIKLELCAIDLSYIFDVLDINYVSFGGIATGDFYVSGVTQGMDNMVAYTPGLKIKDMEYNHARLGNAVIRSSWVGDEKMVRIDADIEDEPDTFATVRGGIWVAKDSLSFDFDAHNLSVDFMQPFMSAFSSEVTGRATGKAKLYGTFSDIDLEGKLYAHPVKLKIDYTNVYYTCTDTIEIKPGIINIDNVTIKDREGHTANLTGYVKHRYFHEPEFEFTVSNAHDFLCYDTNAAINPIWYGTIYGNGGGTISGYPGVVDITVDMATAPKSKFYFVLDKSEAADDFRFITFTDKRKEAMLAQQKRDDIPEAVAKFKQKKQQDEESSSLFAMDLRATVTPDAQLIIVMDPVGGDRIRAFGSGSLQIGYSSDNDIFTMQGRYTLDKGTYNFTLQDLILKDFTIRPGSYIQFNGDPFAAELDIAAAYRVNANLTDLDKSFATDRDLARTNVPVEAMMYVRGAMEHPDITFDIEMPTVTSDVVRKVKSLISTEDQMSLQIAYLLALNRFYTPEYTGTQRNNNELASVASSTVSAQIGNAFGRLSDNWSFTPYFRTDKGDFSDLEVDLALSSSLLNNRLLINGNLGYRDRSTSTTTFIGDFDIEYLLNRQGTIRLKAYNHFNDANYYLRSALTTQGVGVMYKLDFDDLRDLFRRRRKTAAPNDTISKP